MAFAERKLVRRGGGVFARLGLGGEDGPRGVQITVSAEGKPLYRQKAEEGPGDADRLVARSPGAALKQMNAARRQPGYAWMAGAGGAVLALLSLPAHTLLAVPLAGLTAAAVWRARQADARRRRFHLEYHLDAGARERWTLLNHALAALTRTERVWQITSRARAHGWKRDSGASALVTRTRTALRRETPPGLTSSLTPYCLSLVRQCWLFFPDRLYVRQDGGWEAVEYAHLRVTAGTTRFMEEEGVPRDAQIVGKPWQRAASQAAPSLPITEYGTLEIEARVGPRAGLKTVLHVSSVGAADQFAALFESFQRFRRSDGAMPPQSPPSEGCYARLGLAPACTKAEATRQFRRLVLIHHPDRVSRANPEAGEQTPKEAKDRANVEMQEIVLAYRDLKRLRGW